MCDLIKWQPEQVALLKQTVAKNATDAELEMFIQFCKATKLNPFKKEIWFIKTSAGVQMMTGINGFLAIANASPEFDGMEVELKEEDGKLISATAKVYRKDRKYPSVGTAYYQEYAKNSPTWKQMPRVMLTKVAKSIALREAFPQELNGMYTAEEMPPEFGLSSAQVASQSQENKKIYKYAIQGFQEQDKNVKALEWCEKHGINSYWTEDNGLVAESEKPLPFFKEVELNETE